MADLRITSITKLDVQVENATVLNVAVEIFDETGVLETRLLGFPLGLTEDELKAELSKFLEAYNIDLANSIKNAELEEKHAQADKTIAALTDVTITASSADQAQTAEVTPTETTPTDPAQTQ